MTIILSWWEALLLGILQGISEFLPISSSGHLQIAATLFSGQGQNNLILIITLHAATGLSILVMYRKKITQLLRNLRLQQGRKDVLFLLLSALPAGIIGIGFKASIEQLYASGVFIVGVTLLINGLVLFLPKIVLFNKQPIHRHWNIYNVLLVGLAQAIAILPGISRSGSTISMALLCGIDRKKAVDFSFLMALIPIFGSALLAVIEVLTTEATASTQTSNTVEGLLPIVIGFVAAWGLGLWACYQMIQWVSKGQLQYFAWYCWLVGALCIGYGLWTEV